MNKKGFTIVELLGVMVILGIILVIGLNEYRKYIKKATDDAYDIIAKNINSAAENYVIDHPKAKTVDLDKLIEEDYLEPISDPEGNSNDKCRGKIRYNPEAYSEEENALSSKNFTINLCCEHSYYTYRYPTEEKSKDKYCKVDPYDIRRITDIKVLNVYPYHSGSKVYGDQLKSWMDEYGKGIIKVTPVYIEDFNAKPELYLGSSNSWNYDEVVFGFVDCNGSQDLSAKASELVDKYLSEGGAAIFGHDTLTVQGCGSHTNFNKLAKHVNITLESRPYVAGTQVSIIKEGIFTTYPWNIGDIGTSLTIPKSHVYGQVAHGDVWITFDNEDSDANKIYLSTWGNNAFIQTGHSNGNATPDEQKIIANIIFYTFAKQYVEEEE